MFFSLAGCGSSAGDSEIRFGTGGIGGNYYAYGNAFSQFLEQDSEDQLSLKVKTTAGSAANLRLLSENYLKLAIVQSDTLLDALNGSGIFEGDARSGFRAWPVYIPRVVRSSFPRILTFIPS